MTASRRGQVVIFAGYSGQMSEMLSKVNPGLRSRVADVIDFPGAQSRPRVTAVIDFPGV